MILSSDRPVRLAIQSTPCHLRVVRAALEKMCELAGLDGAQAGQVVLSVDEALANIIRHAYDGADDRPIEVEAAACERDGRRVLEIRLRDFGRPVDPGRIRPRDLADVRPGGLGVHFITELMDTAECLPGPGGVGNVLRMTRKTGVSP